MAPAVAGAGADEGAVWCPPGQVPPRLTRPRHGQQFSRSGFPFCHL